MKIMVVGGGGREHAIVKKIKESSLVEKIYALPGNGGIAEDAECVAIGAKEIDKIVGFAIENKIDYAIVAPDDPLVLGAVDALSEVGIPCFGCIAAGIPLPLSSTVMLLSGLITTRIRSQYPARASSMELSTISYTRWCRPRIEVVPIYIPGLFLTASRPSSTCIWFSS